MLGKEAVELWVLEHACKFCLPAVFKAAWRRSGGRARRGLLPDIYLAMMELHIAVSGDLQRLSADSAAALERGQQLMERVASCDPRLAAHAHLVAKTIISIRIKVLFWYLGRTRSEALAKMNHFFPREGLPLLEKLCPSQTHLVIEFRRFFLPLLAHADLRESYLQTDFQQEYGPAFDQRLQSRTQRFLSLLQSLLPPTPIERILSGSGEEVLGSPGGSQECVTMEIVLQCLSGIHGNTSRATVQALLDLLDMVSPLNPLQRPPTLPLLLLQSQSQPSEEAPCPDSETLDNAQAQTVPPVPNSDSCVLKSVAPVPQSKTPGPAAVPSAPAAAAAAAAGTTSPQSARGSQRRKRSSSSTPEASGGVAARSGSRQETVEGVHTRRRKNTVLTTAAHKKKSLAIQQGVSPKRMTRSKGTVRDEREVQEKRPVCSLRKKSSAEKTADVEVTDSGATVSGVAAADGGVRRSHRLTRKQGVEGEKEDDVCADDTLDKGPSTSSGESTSLIRRRALPRKEHQDTQVHIISSSSDNTPSQPEQPPVILVPDSSSEGLHSDRPRDPDSSLEQGNVADAEDSQHLSGRPVSSHTEGGGETQEGGETSTEAWDVEEWDEAQGSSSQVQGGDSDPDASPLPSPSSSIIPSSCMAEVEEWDIEESEPKAEEVQLPDLSRFAHPSRP